MRWRSGQWIRLGVSMAVTTVCLWLALRKVRLDGLTAVVRGIQWSWLGFALGALVAGYAARIFRWWWMLHLYNPVLQPRSCAWPLIAGFAVNNVVPFRAGDALRVLGFRQQLDTPIARLLGSLLIERILDLTILLGFFVIGMVGLRNDVSRTMYLPTTTGVVSLGLLLWGLLLFRGDQMQALLLRICRSRIPVVRDWSPQLELHVQQLFVALSIVRTLRHALRLLAISTVVWTCEGCTFAAIAHGLHYNGAPFGPWFAMATGSLSTLIPSSPGYVGTFDLFTISGLSAYGASPSLAAAMAFVVHTVLWLPLTAAGILYLLLIYPSRLRGPVGAAAGQGRERA